MFPPNRHLFRVQMKAISFKNDILPLKNVLYRLALRITTNHEEAEDVVQDTMIKIWNKRDDWEQIENLEAFCLTICRHLALDKVRKASHLADNLNIDGLKSQEQTGAAVLNPYEQIILNDRVEMVKTLLNSLPEKQRSCMQLRDFEGKSYKEIAMILGISEEQVKVNIFRARQTIKQKFQESEKYGL